MTKNTHKTATAMGQELIDILSRYGVSMNVANQNRCLQLIKNGADLTLRDSDNPYCDTPLTMAAFCSHSEVMKALLENGADINAKDAKCGASPLMYAVGARNIDSVKYLLEKGADVNAQDKNNNTALVKAVLDGETEIINALIDAGADSGIKDAKGKTVFDYVVTDEDRKNLESAIRKRTEEQFRAAAAQGTKKRHTIRRRPTPGKTT